MSDPHTRIFHELLEPMLRIGLNGTQFRILLWVMRNSYGRMGAKSADYTWGRIARDIRSDRPNVSRGGRAMLEMGVLKVVAAGGEIGINKSRIIELGGGAKTHGGCENARVRERTPKRVQSAPPYSL